MLPGLSIITDVRLAAGRAEAARQAAGECIHAMRSDETKIVYEPIVSLARAAVDVGLGADLVAVLETKSETLWQRIGIALCAGRFADAADLMAETGLRPDEARVRLRAAEALVLDGDRVSADEQLHHALAFFRAVDASAFVREGERLLAATA